MKRVVLIGAGHAHLFVASHAEALRAAGADVTLVDPGVFWYSGLATGVLGGMYAPEEDQIPLRPFAVRNGIRLIESKAAALNPHLRVIQLADGQCLSYDVLSLSIGSESEVPFPQLPQGGWTPKPIPKMAELMLHLQQRMRAQESPLRMAVLGGGPTGCETAANLAALALRCEAAAAVSLYHRGHRLTKQFPERVSRLLAHDLRRRGVRVCLDMAIHGIEGGVLRHQRGTEAFDVLVIATGLRAPRVLKDFQLTLDAAGNLVVDKCLRAPAGDRIFGAGDCINFAGRALPKLGVFGVRQAPVLLHNLIATLKGEPLVEYLPQKHYLSILNYGDGTALAVRGGLYWRGRLSMRLKHRLDLSFLQKYRGL